VQQYYIQLFFILFFSSCTHCCNISCCPVGGDKGITEEKENFMFLFAFIYLFIYLHAFINS